MWTPFNAPRLYCSRFAVKTREWLLDYAAPVLGARATGALLP